jgi:methyl-accepting chemotaxis protein
MSFVISNLISIIAASIAATLLLNRFFKKSVFVRIGLIWLFNLLFIMVMIGIKYKFYDGNIPADVVITVIDIIISVICFYSASIFVVRPLSKALDKLKVLAEGNLDIIDEKELIHDRDDIGRLYSSTDKLKTNLTQIVNNINLNVGHLSSSARKLSDVSQKLSQEATIQASSAEEVSSSMEQMASNIMQNTENAKEANRNARETEQGVLESVTAAEEAMVYTKQINEKISIIRDIAFQTNILALNAAVEAAHAGEHGKGFAVVASEVRKLAERSASSAQEIENLVKKLNNASDKAGEKLNAIIPKVKNNLKLVNEIALASSEQSSGANQINSAIHQLNQITQHNAFASEEMAGGSLELNNQAEQLNALISYFKIK